MDRDKVAATFRSLQALDTPVHARLLDGTIRLASVDFLRSRPAIWCLPRMQELAAVDGALLAPAEAGALLQGGERRIFVQSYGWQSALHPDPFGDVIARLRRFFDNLDEHGVLPSGCGIFWDFACIPQKPRSPTENATFRDALGSMAGLYASVYTSVVQLKAVPARPVAYDGCLLVFSAGDDVARLRDLFTRFGRLAGCEIVEAGVVRIRFESHAEMERSLAEVTLDGGAWACAEINERPYNDRGWVSDPY